MGMPATPSSPQKLTGLTYGIGQLINDITGTTANNQFSAQQAQIQRDWEQYMSNTSYQRAVADLKEAGLNPAMLYASGGQGASTPSGASASASRGGASMDVIGSIGHVINSINGARWIDATTKKNEMTKGNAKSLYQSVATIAKLLA